MLCAFAEWIRTSWSSYSLCKCSSDFVRLAFTTTHFNGTSLYSKGFNETCSCSPFGHCSSKKINIKNTNIDYTYTPCPKQRGGKGIHRPCDTITSPNVPQLPFHWVVASWTEFFPNKSSHYIVVWVFFCFHGAAAAFSTTTDTMSKFGKSQWDHGILDSFSSGIFTCLGVLLFPLCGRFYIGVRDYCDREWYP